MEQAAVCLIGHLRSLPLPAVHRSIGDNVLSVLSERFAVSLSATLFLNEDNSTTVEGVCNSRANALHAMHALGTDALLHRRMLGTQDNTYLPQNSAISITTAGEPKHKIILRGGHGLH